ncbi:radical SAM protein [bacterium]|nr:radical SAM protein [bacterium]
MKIRAKTEESDIATVYIGEFEENKRVEFVESVQPPIPKEKKWVLLVSSMFGCPVKCRFCDCGIEYNGKLSYAQLLAQIDYLVDKYYPDRFVPVEKFKIQFARNGEPAFNENVITVLQDLPFIYEAPGLMPSFSTIAPKGTDNFFRDLIEVKNRFYPQKFQMQFSIHSTSEKYRDWLMPVKKWDFEEISNYGKDFYGPGDRKITLNFALSEEAEVDIDKLLRHFDPNMYLIKITPVNPTYSAKENKIISHDKYFSELIEKLKEAWYDVILSIGELEENHIGSNCGQYLHKHLKQETPLENSYTYKIR